MRLDNSDSGQLSRLAILILTTFVGIAPVPRVLAQSAVARFVYVANEVSNNISGYSVNSTTGLLTPVVGSPFTMPPRPHWISVNPAGTFAYVVTDDGSTAKLLTLSVNRTTGALTTSRTLSLTSPSFCVPYSELLGKFLLLSCGRTNSLAVYSLDPTTGGPTLIRTASAVSSFPWSQTMDSLSRFLYIAGHADTVMGYTLNTTTGQLTQIPGLPLNARPHSTVPIKAPMGLITALTPSGNFLFIADPTARAISAFSVNASTGALSTVVGSPFSLNGLVPFDIAIHPSGHYLYVGNWYLARIGAFFINGSGALTPINGTPFNTPFLSGPKPGGSVSLAIDSSGHFLYAVSTESNQITGFSINQNTGALSQLGGPLLLPTGTHPFRIVVSP